jgi:hypothetical protein
MIECASTALVRFEQRYVAQHFGGFVALGQNNLPFGPKVELLGGSGEVRVVANRNSRAQDAPDGRSDRTIERQHLVASHFLGPRL